MSNAAKDVSTDAASDVIGAGPTGHSLAARTRARGSSLAAVESELVGVRAATADALAVRRVVFCDLEAAAPRSADQARRAGHYIRVPDMDLATSVAVTRQVPIGRPSHARSSFPTISDVWPLLLDAMQTVARA